jgi:F420H(2)-dependent quinone reductase
MNRNCKGVAPRMQGVNTMTSAQVKIQLFFSKYITAPKPHRFLYRLTGGLIGSRLPGVRPGVLLLTVNGRKSGRPRTTPLVYFELDGKLVVAATNNGEDRHPAWLWNLMSAPEATVQIGSSTRTIRGRLAQCDERDQLWEQIIEIHPLFCAYQKKTERCIPVIVLEPVS